MRPDRFTMLKVFHGGELHNHREVVQRDLTYAECCDEDRFPLGFHDDDSRGKYMFTHVLTECVDKT